MTETGPEPSRTVVVAGGGPTGLLVACELALAGVHAIVVEPDGAKPDHSAGMAIHGRTLEALEQRGLTERLRAEGLIPWPRTPFGFLWLDVDVVGPEDHTYGMAQWRTERVLRARAGELGVEIRTSQRVTGYVEDADGVTVTVSAASPAGPAPGAATVEAAYLIGCDGAFSTVRQLAGIAWDRHPPSAYGGVLGDLPVENGVPEVLDAGLHPAGVFGAIPIPPDKLRLMTVEFGGVPPGPGEPAPDAAELRASVKRIVGRDPDLRDLVFQARFGHESTFADTFRRGRVFLAGDAAHVLFVSGTQGLNLGVQDALNLGWKLAAEINGWAPPGLLDSYDAERRPAAVNACRHARAQLALMHPLDRVAPLRDLVAELLRFDEVNRYLLRMPTEARYPSPPPGGSPLVGYRLPNVPLDTADGRIPAAALLHAAHGLVLEFGTDVAAPPRLDLRGWAGRFDVVRARHDLAGDAAVGHAKLVVVRPDGHVAYAGAPHDGQDAPALAQALSTWFGDPVGTRC
ncbi:FAD-dependent monooxygenase [Frankia sp. AgB1.9]|uniref:FAD-dependent monooxygenase n=1 Tax=unclassified Frankia TaxID=2632575 RepID=UPI001932307C|nr:MULTISPECIES: FAD-dependent monooxygenase [unclassified Frankia]MBL7492311.1 FAD-dependent monooxygenase [Frankia sp. AgW1.1]MBL7551860.1 FAD-dependent monooxygenase [Frankia sp. AgB1.9]MBL7617934.1 FAD-dependent monooxygenase [Frankia sp. AgB1.8]